MPGEIARLYKVITYISTTLALILTSFAHFSWTRTALFPLIAPNHLSILLNFRFTSLEIGRPTECKQTLPWILLLLLVNWQ